MAGIARRSTSSRCAALSRSNKIAPKTRGVRVLTRPPRISGAPDHVAIGVTAMPASARCLAVPPVERISTPRAVRARASSRMPVLSETDRIARSTFRIQDDAARLVVDALAQYAVMPLLGQGLFDAARVFAVEVLDDHVEVGRGELGARRGDLPVGGEGPGVRVEWEESENQQQSLHVSHRT